LSTAKARRPEDSRDNTAESNGTVLSAPTNVPEPSSVVTAMPKSGPKKPPTNSVPIVARSGQ
jgi:hypothetical protein